MTLLLPIDIAESDTDEASDFTTASLSAKDANSASPLEGWFPMKRSKVDYKYSAYDYPNW